MLEKWVMGEVTLTPPFPLHSISGSATGDMFIMRQQVTGSQWWVRLVGIYICLDYHVCMLSYTDV